MSSLKKLAIKGSVWTILGYGLSQFLRLCSNVILTRLLVPELFGLMALVSVFILGLNLFSDIGIGASIIQNKRGDEPDFYNTAWTVQLVRGIGLWLVSLVIAIPIANFYQESELLWLVPVVSLSTIIAGLDSTSLFKLNRDMAVAKLTIIELGTQIASLVVMVVWAYFSPTIWSLVIGNFVGVTLKMLISHRLIPGYQNRWTWNQEALKELVSFGRWIFISTAMTFLAAQADRLILGKILTLELLGIYNVAITFALLPQAVMERIGGRIIFPVISQKADLPRADLRAKILQKRFLILISGIGLLIVFVGFGDLLIQILYDARYHEAAWMLPILSLGIWPNLLTVTMSSALLGVGQPIYGAWGNFLKFIYMVIFIPLAYYWLGVPGAIIVVALNDLPLYLAVNYGLWREKLSSIVQDVQVTTLLIGLIVIIVGIRSVLGWGIPIQGMFNQGG